MKQPDPQDWTRYWQRPTITSFGDMFPNNYDDTMLEFWQGQLTGELEHVVDVACGNGALSWIADDILNSDSLRYDAAAAARETRASIDYFSKDLLAGSEVADGNPANIIFIVGFPRCGSTLIEQILSSHPEVSAAGETLALRHAIRGFQQRRNPSAPYPEWLGMQPAGALAEIADDYLRRVSEFRRGAFMTDKLLDNFRFIGVIHMIFPNARIIDARRNPIDVCYSCYKRLFNLSAVPFTYDLDNLARAYRDYRDLMRHWNEVLPGRIHTVDYEQLVNHQESTTRNLLEYCGLSWDDACLQFYRNARTVMTNSNVQVRQPLYGDSIDRWKVYEDYLGPLLALSND